MQDALADRDLVHRQTAATVVQHLALGVAGLSCEDALTHLLNFVWPNVFEDSPHLINGVMGAIDGCRLALGPCVVLHYTLQVGAGAPGLVQRLVLEGVFEGVYQQHCNVVTFVDEISGSPCACCSKCCASISGALSMMGLPGRTADMLLLLLLSPVASCRRVCSTPRARCARRTGRCTTTCTSGRRTRWWPLHPASLTQRTAPTPTCATSWTLCCSWL